MKNNKRLSNNSPKSPVHAKLKETISTNQIHKLNGKISRKSLTNKEIRKLFWKKIQDVQFNKLDSIEISFPYDETPRIVLTNEMLSSLFELTQLRNLQINNAQVNSLPESLGKLSNLVSLEINNCQLASLPKSLLQ
jgi:Leucine-rich repeat (LRR) protein